MKLFLSTPGIWVHVEGETSPLFNSDGYVTATDSSNTLISDLQQYIRYAAQHNILVFITLWNAAVKQVLFYYIAECLPHGFR